MADKRILTMPWWYALVAICVAMALLVAGGMGYTSYVDGEREAAEREADRRWCQLLVTLDQAYSAVPPSTELGRRVAGAIHTLRVDLDC